MSFKKTTKIYVFLYFLTAIRTTNQESCKTILKLRLEKLIFNNNKKQNNQLLTIFLFCDVKFKIQK